MPICALDKGAIYGDSKGGTFLNSMVTVLRTAYLLSDQHPNQLQRLSRLFSGLQSAHGGHGSTGSFGLEKIRPRKEDLPSPPSSRGFREVGALREPEDGRCVQLTIGDIRTLLEA